MGRPYPLNELPLTRAVLRGETVTDVRWTIRRPDGVQILVIGSARPVIAADGTKLGAVLTLRDDTARAAAEMALRDSEAKFRTITEAMPQMVWSTRADGHHDYFNSRWYEYTGTSEGATDGEQWSTMLHPDDRERAWARWRDSLATGETYEIEYRLWHRTGQYRWVLARAMPVRDQVGRIFRWMGTCTDIDDQVLVRDTLTRSHDELERRVDERTRDLASALERLRSEVSERERAEEALRQAQKMEAVGQLTGGIAHDFNNLLTIVIGNMDMAQRALSTGDELRVRRAIDNAAKGAERAATLTQRLLAFSRRQPLVPKPVEVNKLIAGMSDLLKRALGETVEIETRLADNLWRTEADPNQLESAILNLAVNARDAMPNGGKMTIETSNARLDGGQAAGTADNLARSFVMIAVNDTGHGMSKDVLDRAFEPFFTTKEVGKGTGLGLSQVYGFVSQSGGQVKIVSQEGQGTTIKIYLPRLIVEAEHAETSDHIEAMPECRAETVLVVEDNDDVRAYTVEILTELGYRVLEASDGAAALRLLDDAILSVQLLFTDVVMPGMTGRELADAARERRPELRVLYTTGYARDAITQDGGRLDQGVELITKPFTYRALATKVRDVLDAD